MINTREWAFLGTGALIGGLVSYIFTKNYYKSKIESVINKNLTEEYQEESDDIYDLPEDNTPENHFVEEQVEPDEPYNASEDISLYEKLVDSYNGEEFGSDNDDTYSNVLFLSSESYSEFFDGCEENVNAAQQRVSEANAKGVPASVEDIRDSEPYSVLDFDIYIPDRKEQHQEVYLFDNQLQEIVSIADSCSMFGCDISGLARMISDEEDEQLHIVNLTKRFMAEITLQKDSFYNHPKGRLLLQQIEDDAL